jgi:hypothetical protein
MYLERVPNRNSPPAVLLRESYRGEDGKVKKRTIANLSGLSDTVIKGVQAALKGEAVGRDEAVVDPQRSLVLDQGRQHGAAAAIVGFMRKVGLERMIDGLPSRERDVVMAMVADRLLHGDSKLATARHCQAQTAATSLGSLLGVEDLDEQECYRAMDWLLERQSRIEKRLVKKHFTPGSALLFDLSSSYFEGHTCPLAQFGYSRDHRGDLLQVNYGLYCTDDGTPVAVDVLPGNHGDRTAFPAAVRRIRDEFGGHKVIFIGDRGMIGEKIIDELLRGLEGADWITALANPTIRRLEREGAIETSLFDDFDLGSITHPDFPDERLIICRNPALAAKRKHARQALLDATEMRLRRIQNQVANPKGRLRGIDRIGVAVGKVIDRKKVGKHFDITITDTSFSFSRNQARIDAEAALDGLYVIRTSLTQDRMSDADTVAHYKNLAMVERAFRSFKSMDVQVRPIHHRTADRVRAHIFICMLACHVEHAMRKAIAPLLFQDESKPQRTDEDVVKPATRSLSARTKDASRKTNDNWPVSSFRDVLNSLGGIVRTQCHFKGHRTEPFHTISRPNPYQAHILHLLGVTMLL